MNKLYTSGEYILKNPTYHIEDSKFKSNNFIKILKKIVLIFKVLKILLILGVVLVRF
ncbi:hypothetical protein OAO77_02165 [Candidatus Pelagibacter sp.]|nr:hypothetical protein [Candidatus Pelagibacter sp.]